MPATNVRQVRPAREAEKIRALRTKHARVERELALERGRQAVALLYNDGAAAAKSAGAVKSLEAELQRLAGELAAARTPNKSQPPKASPSTKAKPPERKSLLRQVARQPAAPAARPAAKVPNSPAPRGEITSMAEAERVIAAVWPFLDDKRAAQIAVERATGNISAALRIATRLRDEFAPAHST
jgi:hypothetical protein